MDVTPTRRALLATLAAGAAGCSATTGTPTDTPTDTPTEHGDPQRTIELSADRIRGVDQGDQWELTVTTAVAFQAGLGPASVEGAAVVAYDRDRTPVASEWLADWGTPAPGRPLPEVDVVLRPPSLPAWVSFRFDGAEGAVFATAYRYVGDRPAETVETDDWDGTRFQQGDGPLPDG